MQHTHNQIKPRVTTTLVTHNQPLQNVSWHSWLTQVKKAVVSYVHQRGWSINTHDIDDITQEILLGLWQWDMHRYDVHKGTQHGFMMKRLRWRVADYFRRLQKQKKALATEKILSDTYEEIQEEHVHKEIIHAKTNMFQQMSICFASAGWWCPWPRRVAMQYADVRALTVVFVHDVEGISLSDIAALWGKNVSNIWRARQRGLRFLRRWVEYYGAI